MKKIVLFVLIIISFGFFIFSFKNKSSITPSPKIARKIKTPTEEKTTIIAKDLEIPWDIVFLPDKSLLFTERTGRVKQINNEKNITLAADISKVKHIGEGGLLGIALHPDFENNKYVYLYYSYSIAGDNILNRVTRYKFDNKQLKGEEIIIDAIPGAVNHNGGRIKFGPDKFLYITTGDALNPSLAQDKNSLAGKILRTTDKGEPVLDNPFNNLIYSYGHRNPQGLAWDDKGRFWATEHGSQAHDELNLIEKGKNYGWPIIQGDEKQEGMVSPVIQSGQSITWAPGAAVFYNGSIFFAGLAGQSLFEYKLADKSLKKHFQEEFGRIRAATLGDNGYLYITTSNTDDRGNPKEDDDKLIKIDIKTQVSQSSPEIKSDKKNTVVYQNSGFSPKTLTVKTVAVVVFINQSDKSMWTASDPHPIHSDFPEFDAKKGFNQGEENYNFTFTEPRKYNYHNHLSPKDKGTIIVE